MLAKNSDFALLANKLRSCRRRWVRAGSPEIEDGRRAQGGEVEAAGAGGGLLDNLAALRVAECLLLLLSSTEGTEECEG